MFTPAPPHDEEPLDPAAILRIGTIAEVDLASARVVVAMGEIRTAPVPFSTGRAGATRIWSPPAVGEQVLVACPDGDIEAAIVLAAIPRDIFPPAGNSETEAVEFADGARLSYDPQAHRLACILPTGATIAIDSPGGVAIDVADADLSITGNVRITGDIELTGTMTATGDVVADGKSLTGHRHTAVQSGTAVSGPPQ